jgi:lysophospholipase L1-like esterase
MRILVGAAMALLVGCSSSTGSGGGGGGDANIGGGDAMAGGGSAAGGGSGDGGGTAAGGGTVGGVAQVIAFGDSVSTSYCASAKHGYVDMIVNNDDTKYPDYAGKDLAHHFIGVATKNIALAGTTSCDFATSDIHTDLAGLPDVNQTIIVITLGGNDLIHPYTCGTPHDCQEYCSTLAQATPFSANYKTRMVALINELKSDAKGNVSVFLANIYDPTDLVGDIQNANVSGNHLPAWPGGLDVLALYNSTIADIATTTGATVVDMHAAMLGHGIHYNDTSNMYYDAADPTYWYCANLEDPNDRGYNAIRGVFWNAIATKLGF